MVKKHKPNLRQQVAEQNLILIAVINLTGITFSQIDIEVQKIIANKSMKGKLDEG
jgi:hypothetical protein